MTDADTLPALGLLAREAGAQWIAAEAVALAERLAEGRFYVVCVGQFKRGKSTLLNTLVGSPVLPTGVVPVTAAVTVVRHGDRLAARVRFRDRDWEDCDPTALATYVSEEHNPGNEKGVTGVEVFVPSPLLRSGMCFVDTPGIGSISVANTEATRGVVPHIDAALLVLGADPPITGEELTLVRDVAAAVRDIIVVLSKADRQSDAERAEAIHFTRRVLEETLGRPVGPILQVSSTERGSAGAPARDWDRLVSQLEGLADQSAAELVKAAEARETRALSGVLLRELDEQRRALIEPLEQSGARIRTLQQAVVEGERTLVDLGHLLTAEQERFTRRLTEERDAFFARALAAGAPQLRTAIRRDPSQDRGLRARALDAAREIARHWLERWRHEEEPKAEALYRQTEQRFAEVVNTFRARLAAVPGLESLPPLRAHEGFRACSRLYYTEMLHTAPGSGSRWLQDVLAPWRRTQAVEQAAREYLEELLHVNSSRIKNDFSERALESRRLLEREIRESLRRLTESAVRALDTARRTRAAGAAAVEARLKFLDDLRVRVDALSAVDRATR